MWASINEDYMTEESDDETGGSFRQHHLKWRSESMFILLHVETMLCAT